MLGVKLNGSRDNPGSPDEVYAEQRIYTPPPDGREPSDSDFRWLKAPNAQSDKEFKLQPGDRMILAGFNHQIWNMDPDAPCEISVVRHGYGLRDQPKVEGPCNPCYRYPP